MRRNGLRLRSLKEEGKAASFSKSLRRGVSVSGEPGAEKEGDGKTPRGLGGHGKNSLTIFKLKV